MHNDPFNNGGVGNGWLRNFELLRARRHVVSSQTAIRGTSNMAHPPRRPGVVEAKGAEMVLKGKSGDGVGEKKRRHLPSVTFRCLG